MFVVQYLGSSRSWTSCSHSSKPGVDSRGRAEPHLAVGRSSLLGRVQTGLKGGGMKDSDLTGDSSLARANQSMGICKSEGTVDRRLKSQKREKEWAQPHARVFDPKGIENETRIYVNYLWSGVTILNLLFPISPLPCFSFSRRQFKGTLPIPSLRWNKTQTVPSADRSSYLYCLSNPKILIHGGVLRVGSDPIPAVKLLIDPAHLPLKLECLSFIEEATHPRNR
ncbi:hypothetical protein VNO80_06710 [Phaseolus coccineus]|uniref:Uncharacterized protein n=1 Tax=Phaseolus coccineus TaxID=3886 RepID=A0AAN9RP32_PHACN